jgi:hypothetical protein
MRDERYPPGFRRNGLNEDTEKCVENSMQIRGGPPEESSVRFMAAGDRGGDPVASRRLVIGRRVNSSPFWH